MTMATAGDKPAAAAAGDDGRRRPEEEEEANAVFEAKHAELVAEARGVAREFGVDVRAVAFRPDGGAAVQHELLGLGREARVRAAVRRAVARYVAAMGPKEVAEHGRQLHALRNIVVRELQAKAAAAAAAAGAKRAAPEQREADGAGAGGDSKIRRIVIDIE